MTLRKFFKGILAVCVIMVVTAVLCELAFRALLFSQVGFMERFRKPGLYADYTTDVEWWKLYQAFQKPQPEFEFEKRLDPLLGWTGDFSQNSYQHIDRNRVGLRQPVLFYGDSFTHCVTPAGTCFQDIWNRDSLFARDHYALNYGVLGYGVDQISLLFHKSIGLFSHPHVIIGMYTRDLDRSVLPYFTAPKPYFKLVGDELKLFGTPVTQPPREYFAAHGPRIWSYLYRLWLYQDGRPWRLRRYLRGTDAKLESIRTINTRLISSMVQETKDRKLPCFFVIFDGVDEVEKVNWRDEFVAKLVTSLGVESLSTRSVILQDMERTGRPLKSYFLPDGHPNAYQNQLIALAIQRTLFASAAPPQVAVR